ncbi:MAG: hypothetical protein FWG83_01900 [Oscillospiraceae bacterium]|nr:hypothetical protein [Oscillospiraceae bacterium]
MKNCIQCGGNRWVDGKLDGYGGPIFLPAGKILSGMGMSASACADCGHLEIKIREKDMSKLKKHAK